MLSASSSVFVLLTKTFVRDTKNVNSGNKEPELVARRPLWLLPIYTDAMQQCFIRASEVDIALLLCLHAPAYCVAAVIYEHCQHLYRAIIDH